jgi:hypothetical protein
MKRHARFGVLAVLVAMAIAPAASADTGPYTSCAQVASANPGAPDGMYNIVAGNTTVPEFCQGLSGSDPRGYLTLGNTGQANYSVENDPRFYTRTEFTKVRLVGNGDSVGGVTCTADACIDTTDQAFSTSTGGSQFGASVAYALAPGCGLYNGGPNGSANVDLTGTNLSVVPNAFQAVGFIAYGGATYSSNNQVVDLWGNGWCGDEQPVSYPLLPLTVSDPGDLAISPLPDQTVNATAPSGATVTFAAPVSDPGDSTPPAATCDPASGSVFSIGTTSVTCSVSDSDDPNGTQTRSFTVTVVGAAGQATELATTAQAYGGSFADQVQAAEASIASGRLTTAANQLRAFEHHVRAQSGKQIPSAQATALIASAEQIIATMGG